MCENGSVGLYRDVDFTWGKKDRVENALLGMKRYTGVLAGMWKLRGIGGIKREDVRFIQMKRMSHLFVRCSETIKWRPVF
jgi:hypothetical protein